MAAQDMLESFLTKCRKRRKVDTTSQHQDTYAVVDTVLAKLFAQLEKTKELYAMLQEAHHIVVPEIEPILKTTGQYNALCMIYKQTKDDDKLLQTWAKWALLLTLNDVAHMLQGLSKGNGQTRIFSTRYPI